MKEIVQITAVCGIMIIWFLLISAPLLLVLYRKPKKILVAASFAIPSEALFIFLLLIGALPNLLTLWIAALVSGPLTFLLVLFWLSLAVYMQGKTWEDYVESMMRKTYESDTRSNP